MAHFHIDYSANLEERLDIGAFCAVIRDAAHETGLFALAGIRVRATAVTHCVIADGQSRHAFLDLSIRLRGGRSEEDKQRAVKHIFGKAEEFCSDVMASSSFMLSMEMRDIDPELSPKASSIRTYIPGESR